METPVDLNPAQQEVVALLGASRAERPVFETTLRSELKTAIEQGLAPLVERANKIDDTIWVSKHALGQVMGCERKYLAEEEAQFEWSVPLAEVPLLTRQSSCPFIGAVNQNRWRSSTSL